MTRTHQSLLHLYPNDYRDRFAGEMLQAFGQAMEELRGQRMRVQVRFLLTEWIGLLAGAANEWVAKLTTDPAVRGRQLPDLRMMRPPNVPRELWFARV
jgi:hypothetical protein